ncbi:MAG: hypothetical protein RL095_3010 [Verrucomicrobiota bacterium]
MIETIVCSHSRELHLLNLASLPFWHRDPFDRLMIAQARAEAIPVLSQDGVFAKYDIQLIG